MDLIRRVTVWVLLFIGLATCTLGLTIGIVETYHVLGNVHPFGYPPFIMSALFIIGGASLVQTGSVKDSLNNLIEITPLLKSTRVNGRRVNDPQTGEMQSPKKEEK